MCLFVADIFRFRKVVSCHWRTVLEFKNETSFGFRVIGNGVFCGSAMREILIPDLVEIIGSEGFKRCQLKKIVVPNSVRRLGTDAFRECGRLRCVYISRQRI
jgi:hypothetical protein